MTLENSDLDVSRLTTLDENSSLLELKIKGNKGGEKELIPMFDSLSRNGTLRGLDVSGHMAVPWPRLGQYVATTFSLVNLKVSVSIETINDHLALLLDGLASNSSLATVHVERGYHWRYDPPAPPSIETITTIQQSTFRFMKENQTLKELVILADLDWHFLQGFIEGLSFNSSLLSLSLPAINRPNSEELLQILRSLPEALSTNSTLISFRLPRLLFFHPSHDNMLLALADMTRSMSMNGALVDFPDYSRLIPTYCARNYWNYCQTQLSLLSLLLKSPLLASKD